MVRPLEVDGDVALGWRESFSEGLERGLARKEAALLPIGDASCGDEDDACWRRAAQDAGAAFVVRARVTKTESDYALSVALVAVDSGEEVAHTEQQCELCGLADAGTLLEDMAGTMAARIEALANAKAVVLFESTPSGATLFVDGAEVGPMPLSRELDAGTHQAEAVLKGHVSQRRSFETETAVDQTVRFELAAVPKQKNTFVRPLGWASLGVGVAAAAAGGVLVAIDEDPITSRCSGDNVNSVGVCKFRRDTLVGGATLIAVGAAAVVTGVVLLVRSRKRTSQTARWTPSGSGVTLRF